MRRFQVPRGENKPELTLKGLCRQRNFAGAVWQMSLTSLVTVYNTTYYISGQLDSKLIMETVCWFS
jgi:hypothetical protein